MSIKSDTASIDSILHALYESISHEVGGRPDWERLRSLFIQGARIIPPALESAPLVVMDLETFVARVEENLDRREDDEEGFHEMELARRVERFGNVAHVWSTYETRSSLQDPSPASRGVNSFQFVHYDERWWVMTILWDIERPGNPIPDEYLGNLSDKSTATGLVQL